MCSPNLNNPIISTSGLDGPVVICISLIFACVVGGLAYYGKSSLVDTDIIQKTPELPAKYIKPVLDDNPLGIIIDFSPLIIKDRLKSILTSMSDIDILHIMDYHYLIAMESLIITLFYLVLNGFLDYLDLYSRLILLFEKILYIKAGYSKLFTLLFFIYWKFLVYAKPSYYQFPLLGVVMLKYLNVLQEFTILLYEILVRGVGRHVEDISAVLMTIFISVNDIAMSVFNQGLASLNTYPESLTAIFSPYIIKRVFLIWYEIFQQPINIFDRDLRESFEDSFSELWLSIINGVTYHIGLHEDVELEYNYYLAHPNILLILGYAKYRNIYEALWLVDDTDYANIINIFFCWFIQLISTTTF